MKKLFLLLFITALVMECPGAHDVYAAEKNAVLLNETFNNNVTNGAARASVSGGYDSRVVEFSRNSAVKNKALLLHCDAEDFVSAQFSFAARRTVFLDFEIMVGEAEGGDITLKDTSSSEHRLLRINGEGALLTGEGRRLPANVKGSFVRIGVYVNVATKRSDIYINGHAAVTRYYSPDMRLLNISALKMGFLSTADTEGNFYVNSVRAYDSGKPLNIAGPPYNPQALEFTPGTNAPAEAVVYASIDFESGMGTFSQVLRKDDANIIEVALDAETGNNYLKTEIVAVDSLIDHNVSNLANKTVIEADFYIEQIGGKASLFAGSHPNVSGVNEFVNITAGSVLVTHDNKMIKKLKNNVWCTISVVYNMNRKTFDAYVDNELVLAGYPFKNTAGENLKFVRMQFRTTDGPTKMRIDNFRIYAGKVPAGKAVSGPARTGEQQQAGQPEYIESSGNGGSGGNEGPGEIEETENYQGDGE